MKRATAKEKKPEVAEDAMQIVTFQVGGEEYGLDIRSITEVIRPLKITPLPRMPEFIEGVINLRGVIIPVVDLRKRFSPGKAVQQLKTVRIMIVRGAVPNEAGDGKELLGLLVDSVKEVLSILQKDIEPPPAAATGQNAEFISGMGKVGERLVIFLDITRILSRQERSALAEAETEGT
jgi:purine-binding chemotaxis protein CheW